MKPRLRLALLFAAGLLLALCWLLGARSAGTVPPTTTPGPEHGRIADSGAEAHPDTAADVAIERREVTNGGAVPVGMRRLRVVRDLDSTPIVGASVFFGRPADERLWYVHPAAEEFSNCFGNPFERLRCLGHRLCSDADGAVLLPGPVAAMKVAAVAGELTGYVALPAVEPEDGYCLRLAAKPRWIIEVQDCLGRPAVAAPVAMHRDPGLGGSPPINEWEVIGVTDTAGRLVVVEPEPMLQELGQCQKKLLRVYGPYLGDAGATISGESASAQVVQLRLPPTGSVDIQACDGRGRPVHGLDTVYVSDNEWPSRDHESDLVVTLDANGSAHLPFVALGKQLAFSRMFSPGPSCVGPVQMGEVVCVRFGGEGEPTCCGELHDVDGRPLAHRVVMFGVLSADAEQVEPYRSGIATTDADGRFTLVSAWPLDLHGPLRGKLWLMEPASHLPQRTANFGSTPLVDGVADVGVLVAEAPRPCWTGRVRSDDGAALEGLSIDWARSDYWTDASYEVDPGSKVRVYCRADAEARRLRFSAPDRLSVVCEVATGEQDIVLARGGGILLSVQLDPSLRELAAMLRATLRDDRGVVVGRRWLACPGKIARAEWRSLPAGSYQLLLESPGACGVHVERTGLLVPAGGMCRDPALDIDLRLQLGVRALHLVDERGDLDSDTSGSVLLARGDGSFDSFTFRGAHPTFVTACPDVSGEVRVADHAVRGWIGPVPDQPLLLPSLVEARILVSGLPELPDNFSSRLLATNLDERRERVRSFDADLRLFDRLEPAVESWELFDTVQDESQQPGGYSLVRLSKPCRVSAALVLSLGSRQRTLRLSPSERRFDGSELPLIFTVDADEAWRAVQQILAERSPPAGGQGK